MAFSLAIVLAFNLKASALISPAYLGLLMSLLFLPHSSKV